MEDMDLEELQQYQTDLQLTWVAARDGSMVRTLLKKELLQCLQKISELQTKEKTKPGTGDAPVVSAVSTPKGTDDGPSHLPQALPAPDAAVTPLDKLCTKTMKITNYGYDKDDKKFLILYVDIPGLRVTDKNKVRSTFSAHGVELSATDVDGVSYEFVLNSLAKPIVPKASKHVVKRGSVVLKLSKQHQGQVWEAVTIAAASTIKLKQDLVKDTCRQLQAAEAAVPECATDDDRDIFLENSGFHFICNGSVAAAVREKIATRPNKLVSLSLRDTPSARVIIMQVLSWLPNKQFVISLRNWDSFYIPTDHHFDSAQLDIILKNKWILMWFQGYLSAKDIARLPHTIINLALAIANEEDAAAVAGMTISPMLDTIQVHVCRSVEPEYLEPVPDSEELKSLILTFIETTDEDIDWIKACITKLLTKNRECCLTLDGSMLTLIGVLAFSQVLVHNRITTVTLNAPQNIQEKHLAAAVAHYSRFNCELRFSEVPAFVL